eukprot:scaffold3704_cov271-Chaetoceros_neogracile.AAC.5
MSPFLKFEYLCESDDEDESQKPSCGNRKDYSNICASIYYEHIILPSDTFQGICLQYKTIPTKLRQLNKFSGNSLTLAPKKLIIPKLLRALGSIRVQDRTTEEYKIHYIMSCFEFIDYEESKAYCEIHEWDMHKVVECISYDFDCSNCEGRGYTVRQKRKLGTSLKGRQELIGRQEEDECKENHYKLRIQDLDFSVLQKRTFGSLHFDLNRLRKSMTVSTSKTSQNVGDTGDQMFSFEIGIEMKNLSFGQSSSEDIEDSESSESCEKKRYGVEFCSA